MGQAAGEGSDFVVATSDNPRSEDPCAILAEIEPALRATGVATRLSPIVRRAIVLHSERPRRATLCCIAGKGHEKEQILADRTIPFDDAEVALAALRELGYGASAMRLTLAERPSGAGAVAIEAPASIAKCGCARWSAGYSIDSRTRRPGDLFFAVRGERLDGHDFVAAALNAAPLPP